MTYNRRHGQATIVDKPPAITLHQVLGRCCREAGDDQNALAVQVLQQPIQPMRAGDTSHWGCPHRATELRNRSPVQITGSDISDVHPAAEITRHRQHVDHRARGIAELHQPPTVSRNEGTHLARLAPPSRHDSPPFPKHPAPTTEASIRQRNYADPFSTHQTESANHNNRFHLTRHSPGLGIGPPMPTSA
ncbi:MAG: hypothetical protein ABWY20_24410 [Mycobacterium sp.]